MQQLLLVIHVLIAICIISLVLIQHGKGADVGAAFGSGASNTMFGSQGSTPFLFKLTFGLMLSFFVISITLNYLINRSLRERTPAAMTAPMVPATTPIQSNNAQPISIPPGNGGQ